MNMGRKMRELWENRDYLVTPGIANPLQAMIVEKVGYDYVYMGGYDTSLTLLGFPDVGLTTASEMITNARNIAKAVDIPVIADADTGYGNAINVMRTVEDYEAAGVAGIHIEDQTSPKRCGDLAGVMITPIDEAVGKIKAALDAKKDKDFIIIARTDALKAVNGGFEEALRRGKEYARAGADMVYCEFPAQRVEYIKKFAEGMHKEFPNLPLHFDYSAPFQCDNSPLKFSDIAEMGYKEIHIFRAALQAGMQAVWDYAVDIMERKEQALESFETRLSGHPMEDVNTFARFPEIKDLEAKYLPGEEIQKKYKV